VADWVTISSLATAGGTLALAGATYGAVRSSNRSARIAEQALQEQRRPLLVNSRFEDPMQKVMFQGGHWSRAEGGRAAIDEEDGVVYLALPLRNVGAGIAVLQGWYLWPELATSRVGHRPPEDFRRQVRDIYIAPGDVGMWQAALRDTDDDMLGPIAAARAGRTPFSIDLLYSDQVGGQRTISRFGVTPSGDDRWLGNVGLHWNLDTAGPR
jgi:hypothetical protein